MSRRHILPLFLLTGALLTQGAPAQTPARPAQFIVPPGSSNQLLAAVAMDGADNLSFLWTDFSRSSLGLVSTRRFSALDAPLGPAVRLERSRYTSSSGTIVANQRGDVLVTWARFPTADPRGVTEFFLRRTSPVLPTLTLRLKGLGDVAVDDAGNFVVVWTTFTRAGTRVFGQRYNADGTARGPEFNVSTSPIGNHVSPSVAMNPSTGEFVVVWEENLNQGAEGFGVFGQRFGFVTGRQGSELFVFVPSVNARPASGDLFAPQVARAANGRLVVIWRDAGLERGGVLGQRYNNGGAAVGGRLVITGDKHPNSRPQIAMSPAGDFVVAWDDLGGIEAWFRLFHRDGTPAGPVIAQTPLGSSPNLGAAKVAFGGNGTFVYGWTNYDDEGVGHTISFQRFAASPGDEPCVFRNRHFHCDTGRTGGEPEIDSTFDIRDGLPLAGDVDGDGREEFCLFRTNRFDCDSGHDFGAAEASVVFGQAGDSPVMGDVDGDGRDDACVFRGDRFLCDSGHDGGAAETEIIFGAPGDRPLMGDVDGDGRDEVCVSRGGEFRCDTAHDSGEAETVIAFGGNGTPLLGDFDGDGRDDACVHFFQTFWCDTAHDGGEAEVTLRLPRKGRPLMGNIDGL
ncbi:MAG TPA: hypothetical protein VF789_28335 [Thermoanaerobaculia bacterium]